MQTFIHISRQNIFSLHNKYNNYRQAYLHGSINIDLNKDWSYSMRKKKSLSYEGKLCELYIPFCQTTFG